jgi:hypothetical protein
MKTQKVKRKKEAAERNHIEAKLVKAKKDIISIK